MDSKFYALKRRGNLHFTGEGIKSMHPRISGDRKFCLNWGSGCAYCYHLDQGGCSFFFQSCPRHVEFWGQGSNLSHSSDPNHSRDNAKFLAPRPPGNSRVDASWLVWAWKRHFGCLCWHVPPCRWQLCSVNMFWALTTYAAPVLGAKRRYTPEENTVRWVDAILDDISSETKIFFFENFFFVFVF